MLNWRKLLLALPLLACSGTQSKGPTVLTSPKCTLPEWPVAPELYEVTEGCPAGAVCLTIPSVLDLAGWAKAVTEEQRLLGSCKDVVVWRPAPVPVLGPQTYDANHTMPGGSGQ